MLDNDAPWVWPNLAPGTRLAGFMKGYLTLIHIKYLSTGSHGFRKDDFFRFSPL